MRVQDIHHEGCRTLNLKPKSCLNPEHACGLPPTCSFSGALASCGTLHVSARKAEVFKAMRHALRSIVGLVYSIWRVALLNVRGLLSWILLSSMVSWRARLEEPPLGTLPCTDTMCWHTGWRCNGAPKNRRLAASAKQSVHAR